MIQESKAKSKPKAAVPTVDRRLDDSLRPRTFDEYIGQRKLKQTLQVFIAAAKKRNEPIEHILLSGPPGLGKTTLAHLIGVESKRHVHITSGPAIEKGGDLASLLSNLQEGDILFIDEIHRLHRTIEEILYPAMEDHALDVMLGKGMSARSVRLDLPRFTIIGATTRPGLLSRPLRDRFGMTYRLNYYDAADIERILVQSAKRLSIRIAPDAVVEISKRSRLTPRIANRLLRRVRDYAEVESDGHITIDLAKKALEMMEVDTLGLDDTDRKILLTLIEKFEGHPVGLTHLAASIAEEPDTLEEVYEPFLIQQHLLARTPRGRIATREAYKHLDKPYNKS